MYSCPKGHQSTEADYCSECGALIGTSSLSVEPSGAAATGSDICPDCGTLRDGNNRYCEVCRYDFQSKSSFAASATKITPVPAEPEQQTPAQTRQTSAPPEPATVAPPSTDTVAFVVAPKLNVEIIVDPSLASDPEAAGKCPKDAPKRCFPLDLEENLVGRRSDVKGVYPEIEVDDPGASRRHLKLIRQSDGFYAALELGSSNGTALNGSKLIPGVSTPVKIGDEFVIGLWTRLRIIER